MVHRKTKLSIFLAVCLVLSLFETAFLFIPVSAQETYFINTSGEDWYFRIPSFVIPQASITSEWNKQEQINQINMTVDEFNITLNRKVAGSSFPISFESANLTFWYQPPLNEELNLSDYDFVNITHAIKNGEVKIYRPENVVGSYAAYLNFSKMGTTGKAFHLYRPLLIDSAGSRAWGALNITGNILTVSANSIWLAAARYPVTIDPSFGYTTAGGSADDVDTAKVATQFTAPASGTITNLTAYIFTSVATQDTAIYADSGSNTPTSRLSYVQRTDVPLDDYFWVTFSGYTQAIISGNKYWFAWCADSYTQIQYDTAAYYSRVQSDTADPSPPPDDPFGTGTDYSNRVYSIYANYTADVSVYPYVQQQSNVDSSADIGTHSSFAAQQAEPDGTNDTLTEANANAVSEYFGNPAGSGAAYSLVALNTLNGGRWTSGSSASTVYNITFFGSETGSGTRNVKGVICNSSGYILTNGVGSAVTVSGTTGAWYTSTFSTPPTVSPSTAYNLMLVSDSAGFRLFYSSTSGGTQYNDSSNSYASPTNPTDWTNINATNYRIYANTSYSVNYKLDIEEQFTNIPTDTNTNREVCVFMGPYSAAEGIYLQVWNYTASSWTNLTSSLTANQWNNYSVTDYISTYTNLTIRFLDAKQTGDTSESNWQKDASVLHLWNVSGAVSLTLSVPMTFSEAHNKTVSLSNTFSIAVTFAIASLTNIWVILLIAGVMSLSQMTFGSSYTFITQKAHNIALVFAERFVSAKTITFLREHEIILGFPNGFGFESIVSSIAGFSVATTIAINFAFSTARSYVTQTLHGIALAFAEASQRAITFLKTQSIPITFAINGAYSGIAGFAVASVITLTYAYSTIRSIALQKAHEIQVAFTTSGAYQGIAGFAVNAVITLTYAYSSIRQIAIQKLHGVQLALSVISNYTSSVAQVLLGITGAIALAFTYNSSHSFTWQLVSAIPLQLQLSTQTVSLSGLAIAATIAVTFAANHTHAFQFTWKPSINLDVALSGTFSRLLVVFTIFGSIILSLVTAGEMSYTSMGIRISGTIQFMLSHNGFFPLSAYLQSYGEEQMIVGAIIGIVIFAPIIATVVLLRSGRRD